MAVKTYKVGPGTLKVGAGAGQKDWSGQVKSCRVQWSSSESTSDPIPVLSGEELASSTEVTYTAALVANLLQDIDAAGLVEWSWANKGTDLAFEFIPNTAKGRKITGTVRVGPVDVGGDAKDGAPASDISWPIQGNPVIGAV